MVSYMFILMVSYMFMLMVSYMSMLMIILIFGSTSDSPSSIAPSPSVSLPVQ